MPAAVTFFNVAADANYCILSQQNSVFRGNILCKERIQVHPGLFWKLYIKQARVQNKLRHPEGGANQGTHKIFIKGGGGQSNKHTKS